MKLDLRLDLKVSRPRYLGLDLRFNFSLKFGVGQSFVAAHNAYLNYALINFFVAGKLVFAKVFSRHLQFSNSFRLISKLKTFIR